MKRKLILAALCLLGMNNANALIVSVKGHGEIDAAGMQISLTEAEEDPLSGNRVFVISGTLFADGPLTVQIARSEEGMNDEKIIHSSSASWRFSTLLSFKFN